MLRCTGGRGASVRSPATLRPPAGLVEERKKPRDYTADLKRLLASANICDKRWVFEQYDSMVQTNTVESPGGEAGVIRIKGTGNRDQRTEKQGTEKQGTGNRDQGTRNASESGSLSPVPCSLFPERGIDRK